MTIAQTLYKAQFPIETKSEANLREHWTKKASRAKKQRADTYYCCIKEFGPHIKLDKNIKIRVYLDRRASRKLDDDNLASAFKAVRDGVADYLGIDDGDERISWIYDQGKHNICAFHITIAVETLCI